MDSVIQDIRYALRRLVAAPGLTAACVVTLAVGIGGAAATFSVVDAVALRPLPFPDADRLVRISEVTPQGERFSFSEPDYVDYASRMRTVTATAAMRPQQVTMTGAGDPVHVDAAVVTPSIFALLGIRPAAGQVLTDEDARSGGVMISHAMWRDRFGGDRGVVGRTVRLDGAAATIVGVLPERTAFPAGDVWRAFVPSLAADRSDKWLDVIARLAPGASVDAARADAAAAADALAGTYPRLHGWSARVEPLRDWLIGTGLRRMVWILLGAVGTLLALACVNIAGLLMSRAASRQTEMGVRAALGARRGRLIRQLITEHLLLGLAGAALGLLAAAWILAATSVLLHDVLPLGRTAAIDGRVIAATAVMMIACTIVFGLLPAIHAASTDLRSTMGVSSRSATRAGRRWSTALVSLQVMLAMVLLVGSSLLAGSFARLSGVDTGFDATGVLAVPISLPEQRYPEEARAAALDDMMARLAALPNIESIGATATNPFRQWGFANDVTPEERAAGAPESGLFQAGWRSVAPGYFQTLRVPLASGRFFSRDDRDDGVRAAIISKSLAAEMWPGQDAVGRRFYWGGIDGTPRTVVGVVGDVRDVRLEAPAAPMVYLPFAQVPMEEMTLVVRARGAGTGVADSIRRELRRFDPAMPVPDVQRLEASRRAAISVPRFRTVMLGTFGIVALLLASVGLYGVVAFSVAQRTREIAIRLALGARPAQVTQLFFTHGARLAALGAVLGLIASWAAAGVLQSLLFQTSARDPRMFALAAVLLGGVTLLASYLPARRAARLDPVRGLTRD
jgi:predicted permease